LLESIVLPSAKIVKGFETQVFVMADGRVITGTVQSEDQLEVVIRDARHQTRIEKAQIDDRVVSEVSTMPSMANLLTVDNVRDLIAYLVTLQTTPKE
jgi:putative heme-binding domain-containing protein